MTSKRVTEQASEHAEISAANDIQKAKPRGKPVAISEEDIEHALDRLANGDMMRNVTRDLGVTRSALLKRANVDDEFGKTLRLAMEIGTFAMLENAYDTISGGELSTGDVQRDREIARFAQWYASRIGRRHFGERLQIDQGRVVINLPEWATSVSAKPVEDDSTGL